MKTSRFDNIIHAPNRLQICAFLVQLDEAEFQLLRDELAVSDSVLSKHIKQLEKVGYLKLRKSTVNGRQHTWVHLTGEGRQAFKDHVKELKRISEDINRPFVKQLFDEESHAYTYIVHDKDLNTAIIDPVLEQFERDIEYIENQNLQIKYIIETHIHADHITSAYLFKRKYNAQICYGSKNIVYGADKLFDNNEKLTVGTIIFNIFHTPGHTNGCISLYINGYVFTGDTLFIKGSGRTDFQGGSSKDLFNSVRNILYPLPNETVVYPAHDYRGLTSSTIGLEKIWNESICEETEIETFVLNEKNKKRSYPKKFDVAVPSNTFCGDLSKVKKT